MRVYEFARAKGITSAAVMKLAEASGVDVDSALSQLKADSVETLSRSLLKGDAAGLKAEAVAVAERRRVKAAKEYNFVDALNDWELIATIPLDLFAISYQYSVYGQEHGWAYRRCKEGDNLGQKLYELDPVTATYIATAEYPMTKLYCDDNGEPRELN